MPSLMPRALFRVVTFGALAVAAPLQAGEPDSDTESSSPTQQIEDARQYFGITSAGRDCGPTDDGEIVVCGKAKISPRVDPVAPAQRADSKAVALGGSPVPHLGGGVTMKACVLQKCPKELYFIDLASIPEAPAGSDADRVAKGEIPDR